MTKQQQVTRDAAILAKFTRYLVTAVYADVAVYERHSVFNPSIECVTKQLREVYPDADSLTVEYAS